MSFASSDVWIEEFYKYAAGHGVSEELFFSEKNYDRFIETSVDGFREYPLFLHAFGGRYEEKTLERMMSVDFKSRLGVTAGIASSGYESVMLIEPPQAKKTGMLNYFRVADAGAYSLLLKPAMYRLEDFERFAMEKRKFFLDDRTIYLYLFVTKKECQGKGYGKSLMKPVLSFADLNGYRVCLETNSEGNIAMYEHFGFGPVDMSKYKDVMTHCVMIYDKRTDRSIP